LGDQFREMEHNQISCTSLVQSDYTAVLDGLMVQVMSVMVDPHLDGFFLFFIA
jgi:hypothetical protein